MLGDLLHGNVGGGKKIKKSFQLGVSLADAAEIDLEHDWRLL